MKLASTMLTIVLAAFVIVLLQQPTLARSQAGTSISSRLLNGGFESGLEGWYLPSWFEGLVSVDGGEVHSGAGALRFHGRGSGPYVWQEVPASAGERVEFSGWVKVPERHGSMEMTVELVARHAANGNLKVFPMATVAQATDGWVQVGGSAAMPERTASVRLVVRFLVLDGTAFLDDLSLGVESALTPTATAAIATSTPSPTPSASATATATQTATPQPTATWTSTPGPTAPAVTATSTATVTTTPSATPSPTEPGNWGRLTNGGFESGLVGWYLPPWFANLAHVSELDAHSGAMALGFQGKGSGIYVWQEVPASAGERVEVSGWVNVPVRNGSMKMTVELVARHAANGDLKVFPVAAVAETTGGWVVVGGSAAMPERTVSVRLVVRFPVLDGTAYLDDLSLTAVPVPTPTSTTTPSPTTVPSPTTTPTSLPAGRVLYGAWVGIAVNVAGDEAAFERATEKPRAIRHWYWSVSPISWSASNFAGWASTMPDGAILMLSWAPSPVDSTLDNVLAGLHDSYIREWAGALKSYGREVWLRPMWEDNGTWYWWSSGSDWDANRKEKYRAAFRRIVDTFRSEGADNVRFVWSPHVRGYSASTPILSYPGEAYVDWVGLDGYPLRGGRGDFYSTFKADYDALSALGKPMMVAETSIALPQDSDRADYVASLLGYELPANFPGFTAFVWFSEPYLGDLLDTNYPLTLEAFRSGIASPYYRGR